MRVYSLMGNLLALVVLLSCISTLCSSRSTEIIPGKETEWKPVTEKIKKCTEATFLKYNRNKRISRIEPTRYVENVEVGLITVEFFTYDKCGQKSAEARYMVITRKAVEQQDDKDDKDDGTPVNVKRISPSSLSVRKNGGKKGPKKGYLPATPEVQSIVNDLMPLIQKYYPAKIGQIGAIAYKRQIKWDEPYESDIIEIFHVDIIVVHADDPNKRWETDIEFTRTNDDEISLTNIGPRPSR